MLERRATSSITVHTVAKYHFKHAFGCTEICTCRWVRSRFSQCSSAPAARAMTLRHIWSTNHSRGRDSSVRRLRTCGPASTPAKRKPVIDGNRTFVARAPSTPHAGARKTAESRAEDNGIRQCWSSTERGLHAHHNSAQGTGYAHTKRQYIHVPLSTTSGCVLNKTLL